jgi:Domain of unknown function (DUF4434)
MQIPDMTKKSWPFHSLVKPHQQTVFSRVIGRVFGVLLLATLVPGCTSVQPTDRAALVGCLWAVSPGPKPGTLDLSPAELDAIQGLGMTVMVLNGTLIGQPLSPGANDPAEKLFEEGDRRGLSFFVDTSASPAWWTHADPAPELARARARIHLLQARYGRHKSFHGFYVPYELYVMWGAQRELIRTLYREVAACCKSVAPEKPVMISPFFILDNQGLLGDFRWATPEEYQTFWTDVLREAPVDIVALQDRGEHLSYYTDAQCAPFFAAMKNACAATGKQLWANVETGELEVASPADYVARFGRKTHVNDPKTRPYWRGVPADKLAAKLRFVRHYSRTAITWGYHEFVRPSLGPAAAKLYAEYKALLGPPIKQANDHVERSILAK